MMNAGPSMSYNFMDPHLQSDPYDFYEFLRTEAPVYRVPETGVYVISRYEDAKAILSDPKLFSNEFEDGFLALQSKEGRELYESILREKGWIHVLSLQGVDPPLHTKHRKLVESGLSKPAIRDMWPMMNDICHRLIDDFIAKGECEFIEEFAMPFPGKVIANLIGLDPSELKTFKRWADAIVSPISVVLSQQDIVSTAETEVEFQHFLVEQYEDRQKNPRNDIISILANKPASDGNKISLEEYLFIMRQLVAGGFETTTHALAHSLWLLLRFPQEMTKVRENSQYLPKFLEESLRFESPVQGLYRRAMKAVNISGVDIPRDAILMVRYGAANRDAKQFTCPHMLDAERSNLKTHLSFGYGVHFCLGRDIARQELVCGFEAILQRLDNISLARELPDPPHNFSMFQRQLKEVPITFTAKQ